MPPAVRAALAHLLHHLDQLPPARLAAVVPLLLVVCAAAAAAVVAAVVAALAVATCAGIALLARSGVRAAANH